MHGAADGRVRGTLDVVEPEDRQGRVAQGVVDDGLRGTPAFEDRGAHVHSDVTGARQRVPQL
ncbi:Uncharacterised protein [Mycobacterium tuberculosis]|nr:Uncharacterised protein [Mycobacterium tuberculosis]